MRPSQIGTDGCEIVPDVLAPAEVEALRAAFAELAVESDSAVAQNAGRLYALRNLLARVPAVAALAHSPALLDLAQRILGSGAFPVRAIFFDKTPFANWKVAWHQDLTIAVDQRRDDLPGFGPWSVKDGVTSVQPPVAVLAEMVALRVHLDDCHARNGPLRVLPGSHAHGRLAPTEIAAWRAATPEFVCAVPAGGVLAMRPLLLHASAPASDPGHRRVVHLEYAARPLPGGLEWHGRAAQPSPVAVEI